MSVSCWAWHESLGKVYGACAVSEEVGITEMEADVDFCKFCTVNGVGGGSGSNRDFNASIRGMVYCNRSKW
jgi:hypothetical protein